MVGVLAVLALNPNNSLGTVVTQVEKSSATGERTSQGERVEFYRKSLALFEQRPLSGHGTGSLKAETERMASGASTDLGRMTTRNPHNEFIMWAVQLGLPGLLAFVAFCALVLRGSFAGPPLSGMMLRGAWVVFTTGCLMNSLLLDHLEGHAWVLAVGMLLPL
jgi:O-antigen ligase